MDITHWAKTQEGLEVIESQRPFCINGELWQGFEGAAIRIHEDQLVDKEIQTAVDVDATKERVWFVRKNRLEGRLERKKNEYSKRIMELRKEKNDLIQGFKDQKEIGLEPSAFDTKLLTEIDARMSRLQDLAKEKSLEIARAGGKEIPEPPRDIPPGGTQCSFCKKVSPDGHHNPAGWLRGHHMKCKARN